MINRAALLIKPKQPLVDWINQQSDPADCCITLEEVCEDCTVILIPDYETQEEVEATIRELYRWIFESELNAWFIDKTVWPKSRSFKVFQQWFNVEVHSLVVDAGDEPIEHYDLDDVIEGSDDLAD